MAAGCVGAVLSHGMSSTILRVYGALRPAAVALLVALPAPRPAAAHEIPNRVTVHVFARPESGRLRVLVRAPLEAMRDVDFPQRGLGYLDLPRATAMTRASAELWIAGSLAAYEDGQPLGDARIVATRISLPSDRAFAGYESALRTITGPPLDSLTELPWQQAAIDVVLEYPIRSEHSAFTLDSRLARLGVQTTTVLRFITADGVERAYQFQGDPGRIALDPRWHQAALRFVRLGVGHILGGIDHLLFVLCLVIPFRRFRPLALIVTAFTVAHSITLVSAALGVIPDALWFPPLIETVIAASIVYMALENIFGAQVRRRWLLAFGFGLVHGFGFSFALSESLQFAGSHLATSLLAFNLGVELGQLLVLAVAVPVLSWLLERRVRERLGVIVLSALIAHTAWHWTTERFRALREYSFEAPVLDLAFAASAMRGAIVLLIAVGAAWGLSEARRRFAPSDARPLVPDPSSLTPGQS
jgi:hypothetical protein